VPPFTVLHVCMGNICRSPMAERLLVRALGPLDGAPGELVHVHSAGTGGWHAGEEMNPPAAREVAKRGADAGGFTARKLRGEHLDGSDLILTATGEQQQYVLALRPDAAPRTFVLGEFGRLLPAVDRAALPEFAPYGDAVYARGTALVAAVDAARAGRPARDKDDLDDPWGRGDAFFTRVGDEIDQVVRPLAGALLGWPA
jgi:protein-tyrosine phosphatase